MRRWITFSMFLFGLAAFFAGAALVREPLAARLTSLSLAGAPGRVLDVIVPRLREYLSNRQYFLVCNLFIACAAILTFLALSRRPRLILEIKLLCTRRIDGGALLRWMRSLPRASLLGFLVLAVFLALFALNVSFGLRLARTPALHQGNFYEFDPDRVISDLTNPAAAANGTGVHPLYRLLLNPGGYFFTRLGCSPDLVAILMNAFFGSAASALALVLFWVMSEGSLFSVAATLCFSLSMSQLLLSTFPETGSLASCTLILVYLLFWHAARSGRMDLRLWLLVGILTLGVTSANFAQVLICATVAAASIARRNPGEGSWEKALLLVCIALGTTAALALVQRMIYPTTQIFFVPSTYVGTFSFFTPIVWLHPSSGLPELFKQLLLTNLVGSYPQALVAPDGTIRGLTSFHAWSFSFFGWLAAGALLVALLWGAWLCCRAREDRTFFRGIFLCLLFNLAFHSIYGLGEGGILEWMVYSADFTFLTLTLLSGFLGKDSLKIRWLVLPLVALIGMNNIPMLLRILRVCGSLGA